MGWSIEDAEAFRQYELNVPDNKRYEHEHDALGSPVTKP